MAADLSMDKCNVVNQSPPLLTFALFAYNQERFIRDAVLAALSQTYSPLEVILSDDCSSDATYDVMREIAKAYRGPHRVILNRNPENIGVCAHVNKVVGLSSGELIVVAAGDDISLPNRCARMAEVWQATSVSALYCEADIIDASGALVGFWALPIRKSGPVKIDCNKSFISFPFWGAGAAYEKELFTKFGPLPVSLRNEDYVLAMRAALMNGTYCLNERLMQYRKHGANLSFWVKYVNAHGITSKLFVMAQLLENMLTNQKHILSEFQKVCEEGSSARESFRRFMFSTQLRCGLLYALSGRPRQDILCDLNLSRYQLITRMTVELTALIVSLAKTAVSSAVRPMRAYFRTRR